MVLYHIYILQNVYFLDTYHLYIQYRYKNTYRYIGTQLKLNTIKKHDFENDLGISIKITYFLHCALRKSYVYNRENYKQLVSHRDLYRVIFPVLRELVNSVFLIRSVKSLFYIAVV